MKKLLLTLLCVPLIGLGQTKYESQNFIKKYIERYNYYGKLMPKYQKLKWKPGTANVRYSIEFKDNELIIKEKYNRSSMESRIIIPIKSITDIYFNSCEDIMTYYNNDKTERKYIECECLFFKTGSKVIRFENRGVL